MAQFQSTDASPKTLQNQNDYDTKRRTITSMSFSTAMGSGAEPDSRELRTAQMVAGGAALARDSNGRVVFVSGALPDETVLVSYRTTKKDYATADVAEVLDASPSRVVPACEAWHRGCGGCNWQHIEPSAQIEFKADIVREALARTGKIAHPRVEVGGATEPWGYRTTVRVAVDPSGRVGFRSRRSHDLVLTQSCPVAHPRINEMLAAVTADRTEEISLRVGVDHNELAAWGDTGAEIFGLGVGISHGLHAVVHEEVRGHRFRVSAGSFFQASPAAAGLLVDAVAHAVADIDLGKCTVIDAYGGVGLFAATVARRAGHVVLVEASPSACSDARHNLAEQRDVGRAEVVECRLEDWEAVEADVVIADPARSGLDKLAIERLVHTGAQRLVLVSCDAGSLARDARLLADEGYAHRGTVVFDVFPNTSHIEAVTRFDRV
jgi:23S rRNA (uracil1939-C5)-methyltransferase